MGYNTQYNIDQENMYEIGKSGVSVGASVWAEYTTFNKSGTFVDPDTNKAADLKTVQANWQLALAPELEYQFTEKLNFRTGIYLWMYEHYRNEAATTFYHDTVYQTIGLGWSITRDIFLYPNIQFLPDHFSWKMTNVGLQATINLF